MKETCPLCSKTAKFAFRKGNYTYKRCTGCATLFVADTLDPEHVHACYSKDYFEAASSGSGANSERRGYPSYREAEESLKTSFRFKLGQVRKHVPGGKMLEIGAAYGTFLSLAQEHFECSGIDVSSYAAQVAKDDFGLDVRQGSIEQGVAFPDNCFDVVVMWDVIEHLIQPIVGLKEVYRVLKPGGMVFFSTDDAGNWLPRLLGSNWWALAAPLHLCHFSKKGAEAAFRQAGTFKNIGLVSDRRVYGAGEIVSHFGVSYKNQPLMKIGAWLEQTRIGSTPITVSRPEQFIAFACKK